MHCKVLVIPFLLVALSAAAEQIPVEHFGHLPMVDLASVSPSGRYVAAVLHSDDSPNVVVSDFGSRDLTTIVQRKYGEDRIEWINWANDDRLLISVSAPGRGAGFRYRINRLYQIRRDGTDLKQIRRKVVGELSPRDQYMSTDTVLSTLPGDPDHILMQLWDSRDDAFAVFKVNLEKNSFEKQFANTYDVDQWFVDGQGNVVLGIERFRNRVTTWFRPPGGKDWTVLNEREAFDSATFDVVSVSENEAIVLSDRETRFVSAWRYDLRSDEFVEQLFKPEAHDISGTILSTDRTRIIGFSYIDHYRQDHYLDAAAAATYETVKGTFPGYSTYIASASEDMKRMIVVAQKDDAPPKYIWMDLSKPAGGAWFAQYPYLEGKPLAKKQPIEFEAADGVRIEGYLTMPLQTNGEKPSLILFPHGGPRARDTQNFDPWVQFMANRGHAVLQINFRGSEGYGSDFETAGYRQYGQLMQKDLYAGVEWLAEQDLVDTERACIVGFSYGGYAALTAAFQKPKLFKCVGSFAGIADLQGMVKIGSLDTSAKLVLAKVIGDISSAEDRRMLEEVSPINFTDKIRAPILMIHGTQDTRVDVGQSRDFVTRAKAANVDIEYIEIKDGTHFLDEHHNRLTVFRALDQFLEEHL